MTDTLKLLRDATLKLASSEMETDPIPEAIADMCKRCEGKPITKRNTDALEAVFPGLRAVLRRQSFIGTSIEWYAPLDQYNHATQTHVPDRPAQLLIAAGVPGGYKSSARISLSSDTVGARWPGVDELRKRNAWCYSARDERNAERIQSADGIEANPAALYQAATTIDQINLLAAELREHMKSLPPEAARVATDMLKPAADHLDHLGDRE